MRFVERTIKNQMMAIGGSIQFLHASEKGRRAWFVLRLHPDKVHSFRKHLALKNMNIADYGDLLASGWGNTIPQAIIDRFSEAQ